MNVSMPPPPISGVRDASVIMLNLPALTETCSLKSCVTLIDRAE